MRVSRSKAVSAAQAAQQARADGHSVFLYRIDVGRPRNASGPVEDASAIVEAVERAGWHCHQLAYSDGEMRSGACLMLFRLSWPQTDEPGLPRHRVAPFLP